MPRLGHKPPPSWPTARITDGALPGATRLRTDADHEGPIPAPPKSLDGKVNHVLLVHGHAVLTATETAWVYGFQRDRAEACPGRVVPVAEVACAVLERRAVAGRKLAA